MRFVLSIKQDWNLIGFIKKFVYVKILSFYVRVKNRKALIFDIYFWNLSFYV